MILNNIIKYIILSLLICPLSIQSFAQGILTKKKSFAFSNDTVMRVNVDGYLDGNNTSFKIGYGAYKYYLPLYEPLVRMRITNSSNHILENISIVTSEKQNMYNVDTIANIIFKSKLTDLEKLFTIYNYLQNQYFYFYTPEYEGNQEVSDLIKFLGVYGYGHCGTFTSAFDWLAYKCNLNTKIWILAGGGHAVNEVKINDKNIIIDSDNGGYYLNYNNKTLASYSEIFYDSYLYKRTKHFGPLSIYNIEYNYQFYGNWIYWHWDNYTLDTYPFSSINHSLNFNLRPNESISFNNTNDVLFHHILIDGYYPIAGQAKETIRNGNFELVSNFLNTKSELLFHDYSNIKMYKEKSSSPNLHSENNSPSYFIIEISSPFVFVNAKINFSVQNITLNDSLKISFSKDLVHWKEKWKTSKSGTYSDSLDLYTDIAPLYEKATYKYYLRFDLFPNDSSAACGFDSINIKSIFQVSKHFMPKLFSGENIIKYSDATITPHSNINIELQWNEYFFNTPPEDITEPVFPQDNTQVDSLHFTFKWNTPNDLENDAIVDYHFQLSDRPDMLYVLAPNFDQYLYEINNTANSFYKPEVDGFLNPGQTYYWRVRSLDSRGAWSEWSPTFSFTPHGPAQPVNFSFYVSNKDTLVSCLPNKSGNVPLSYEFHTSNEARGFYPNQSTIFKQTRANYISISELNRQYFRVYAIDSLLNKSTVSHYIDKKSILRANVIDNFILHEDSTFYINLITSISNISGKSKPIVEFSNTNNITIRELSYDFEIKTKHDWFGQDSVLITIKDSLTTYNKYIKFNCLPVNDPPKPTKILQQISLNEDEVISKICLSALFENIDNDTLYYRLVIFDKKINIAIDNDTLLLYSKPR